MSGPGEERRLGSMDLRAFHGNASRIRLLAALDRMGTSGEFWRLFFDSLDALGKEDLDAVVLAVGRLSLPTPWWLAAEQGAAA